MKKLLETLYVLTPESYLFHRNENICIAIGGEEKASVPATQVDAIVLFGKNTFSTSLIGFCGEKGISVVFLDANGRFQGRVCGPVSGNVLLRKRQYDRMNDGHFTRSAVLSMLSGKLVNSKHVLLRHARNIKGRDSARAERLLHAANTLASHAALLSQCPDVDGMRGIEGAAAAAYFACFDDMLDCPQGFRFQARSRRPPANEVNAVLSFVYTQLTHRMVSAMETVGLDPAAGYMHTLRPGMPSFALDLMEELRSPLCDRLTLSLFNKGQLEKGDFQRASGGVYLNDKGRKTVLSAWRARCQEEIRHPFLQEKLPIGMIPYAQCMLFARVLRGDLDAYPPFVWR